ncbi:MAG TPA: hypothetical protein VJ183_02020 [Chloroflexia bacterium]|nr:hypothetical protein [Chloroflexia bacterium]
MDSFTFLPSPISHSVELYTTRLLVQGLITGPFKRISDLLNHRESHFAMVDQAALMPLGQQVEARKLTTSIMMNKGNIHLVAATPQARPPGEGAQPGTKAGEGREFYVQKDIYPCYALTDTFVIHGHCHVRQGTNLQTFLEVGDIFLPITNPTISLLVRPNAPWKRDLVLVNKEKLEVMYLVET